MKQKDYLFIGVDVLAMMIILFYFAEIWFASYFCNQLLLEFVISSKIILNEIIKLANEVPYFFQISFDSLLKLSYSIDLCF